MTESQLRSEFNAATRLVHIARGALRRLRPHIIDRDATAHADELMASSEAMSRLLRHRTEGLRMRQEIRAETESVRRQAAAVALYSLEAVAKMVGEWRELVSSYRDDATRTPAFRASLDKLSVDGHVLLAGYRLQQRDRLSKAPVSELLATYFDASQRGDAAGLVDTQIVERLAERTGTPKSAEDLATLKHLREVIGWAHEERVPRDLPDFEALLADVHRLTSRATALQVQVANPQHDLTAAAAYCEQEDELLEAGERSDREDLEAVQAAGA